uniref:Uncharacterized protein n=1 Tax=Arundo donax TaxID=35708 RepID=A0A0A9HEG2_ARUDO
MNSLYDVALLQTINATVILDFQSFGYFLVGKEKIFSIILRWHQYI